MLISYSQLATLFGIVYGPFLLILVIHVIGWLNEKRHEWAETRPAVRAIARRGRLLTDRATSHSDRSLSIGRQIQ
jgi:hypothetical protein